VQRRGAGSSTSPRSRTSTVLASRTFSVVLAVSGIVALIVMARLVEHSLSWSLTSQYRHGFQDLKGRLRNLEKLRDTGNIYLPLGGTEAFTYPPGAILFFWPLLWLPVKHLTLLWTSVSLVALAATLVAVIDHLFHKSLLVTVGIACWTAVLSAIVLAPVSECLEWGQTATILVCLVVVDALVIKGSAKGVLVGVAAAVKIFPGLIILFWLVRREWRAAITSLATTAGVTGLASVLWPASASTFLFKLLLGGGDYDKFTGVANSLASSSLIAMFERPPFHMNFLHVYGELTVVAILVVATLIGAERLWRHDCHLSALVLILITSVIGSPIVWDHYFAFAPLLFLMPFELGWKSPLARTAIVSGLVMVVPWFLFRQPVGRTWWTATYAFGARNALLLACLAVIVASFWQRSPATNPARSANSDDGPFPRLPKPEPASVRGSPGSDRRPAIVAEDHVPDIAATGTPPLAREPENGERNGDLLEH
jgi:alpha-1,2-mannosyltransferase